MLDPWYVLLIGALVAMWILPVMGFVFYRIGKDAGYNSGRIAKIGDLLEDCFAGKESFTGDPDKEDQESNKGNKQ